MNAVELLGFFGAVVAMVAFLGEKINAVVVEIIKE